MTSKTVKTEKLKEKLKVDSLRHNEYYGTPTKSETIENIMNILKLSKDQLKKVNLYREKCDLPAIVL